jgi:hypothetical protein
MEIEKQAVQGITCIHALIFHVDFTEYTVNVYREDVQKTIEWRGR